MTTPQPIPETAPAVPRVFAFLDYREFLRAHYDYRKQTSRSFSYRSFARLAAIPSHSYVKMVIAGERNLALPTARRLGRACDLDRDELAFFLALVKWNQADELGEKQTHWREVLSLRPRSDFHELALSLLTDWRAVAIMDMTRLADFQSDPAWIAGRLRGDTTVDDVRRLLADLHVCGVVRTVDGRLELTGETFYTGGDLPRRVIQLYHHQMAQLGIEALPAVEVARREFSATTITIRKDQLAEFKQDIREFQRSILERVAPIRDGDEVYQLNIQFFPLTKESS